MRRRTTLWVACVAQLVVVLDVSVMNVALPSIRRDLDLGLGSASWVVLGYGVAFAGALLVAARLADAFGAARVLWWSVGAFTVASVAGGLAPDGGFLVAARIAQGLAAAAVSPATFTALTVGFAEGPARTRAIAIWTAVSLAGGGAGNLLGGVLTEWVSWRAVLLINLPIGLAVLVGVSRMPDRGAARPRVPIGWGAGAVSVVAFASATYGLTVLGEAVPAGVAALVLSGAMFAVFAWIERSSARPLVPMGVWRSGTVLRGTVATLLVGMCFQTAIWFFLTFRLQDDAGYAPIQTGLAFLPLTGAMLVVNLLVVPRLLDRWDPRVLIAAGITIAATGTAWFALVGVGDVWTSFVVPSLLVGVGGGLVNTPLATVITAGVADDDAGAVSGLMNTAKQFGGAVGVAVSTGAASLTGTSSAPFLVMTVTLALSGVAMLTTPRRTMVRGRIRRPRGSGPVS